MVLDTDKLTYSIGQVAEIAGVAQSTLRYWETVIHSLHPQKTAGGSRRYNKDTIELILKVKDLLHNQGLTIKGTNLFLEKSKNKDSTELTASATSIAEHTDIKSSGPAITDDKKSDYEHIKNELNTILKILE